MRQHYLDNLKGLLIFLVILGHTIQGLICDYQSNLLFRMIYSFHMPLFFFISGYLTWKKVPDSRLLAKRTKQLLLPFLVWAFISPLFYHLKFDWVYTKSVFLYPDNGLWFLYNLFVYSAMIWGSQKVTYKRVSQEMVLAAMFLVVCTLMAIFKAKFSCSLVCWYFPFFALGFYLRKYEPQIASFKPYLMIMGGVIWCIGVPFWMMREVPLFYQWFNFGGAFSYVYRFLISLAGVFFFFLIGYKYLNVPIKYIETLGTKTLGIYVFQFIIIVYVTFALQFIDFVAIRVLLITLIVTIVCYYIVIGVEKKKVLRQFLIGKQ